MAFLTKDLKIELVDLRTETGTRYSTMRSGIREFVTYLNKSKTALYPRDRLL